MAHFSFQTLPFMEVGKAWISFCIPPEMKPQASFNSQCLLFGVLRPKECNNSLNYKTKYGIIHPLALPSTESYTHSPCQVRNHTHTRPAKYGIIHPLALPSTESYTHSPCQVPDCVKGSLYNNISGDKFSVTS